jgi:predicted protein tyrosine phosphatase
VVAARAPERVISVLDPDFEFPELGRAFHGRHLQLRFHDIHVSAPGQTLPNHDHARALIAFLDGWTRTGPMLVHCRAGIGRSTAVAFIAACLHNPYTSERVIARVLRQASSNARPNETLVGLADAVLQRDGRMSRAIAETATDCRGSKSTRTKPFEMPSQFLREGA